MSRRHSPVFAALTLLTACYTLVQASEAGSAGPAPQVDIVGTWVSEPALGQLGVIQTTISFHEGGAFEQKADFISFCDGQDRGIDCEYFWMIHEGRYSIAGGVVILHIETDRKVLLRTGQTEPEITANSEYPRSDEIQVERQGTELLIRKSPNDEATVFKRER